MGPFTGVSRKIAVLACTSLLITSLAAAKSIKKPTHSSKSTQASKSHVVRTSSKKNSKASKKNQAWRNRQKNIDGLRVREIQSALIRDHYLDGQPNGVWDARSKAAMVKYQKDNGWQTKKVPDSRALIKLGLGADHSNLLNPATASIGQVDTMGKGGAPQQ